MKQRKEKRQKKHRLQKFWNAVLAELRENKNTFIVYGLLRLMVLGVLILQVFNGNYQNVFLCLLTLALMIVPSVIQVTFHVEIPSFFEIIILIFIFAAEILGEISAFYIKFPYWDTVLHTLNGFLCAAVGFSLVDIMNSERRLRFELSPLFMAITAFCFSMTIGVLWEFFEFAMDRIWGLDMQKDTVINAINTTLLDPMKDNNSVKILNIQEVIVNGASLGVGGYLDIGLIDTMWDMIVNFIGAFVFSVMGFFYVKRRETKGLVKELVLEPWSEEKSAGAEE
ncbi:MAG: hypothetical protein J6J86_04010 [Lachnospiraceae bacterium]|nr:hypothetical protein [Lachnospiraceae bacterium]